MEKIYKKMDPLQPSPSEEALLQKLQCSSSKNRKVEQTSTKQGERASTGWKKVKDKRASTKTVESSLIMKSFVRLFSNKNGFPNIVPPTL